MRRAFADTFYFLAPLDSREYRHVEAAEAAHDLEPFYAARAGTRLERELERVGLTTGALRRVLQTLRQRNDDSL